MNKIQKMEVKAVKAYEKMYSSSKLSKARFRGFRRSLRDIVTYYKDIDIYDYYREERDFWLRHEQALNKKEDAFKFMQQQKEECRNYITVNNIKL